VFEHWRTLCASAAYEVSVVFSACGHWEVSIAVLGSGTIVNVTVIWNG